MTQDDLTKRLKKHLLLLAKQRGLSRASQLSKAELIAQLQAIPDSSVAISAISMPTAQDDLSTHTYQSLLELAKQRGLREASRLRKTELLTRLAATTPVSSSPAPPSSHVVLVPERSGFLTAQPVGDSLQGTIPGKFFPHSTELPAPSDPALPSGYNDNRIVLLARDPHWLYAYWDFSTEQISAALGQLDTQQVRLILRIFDVTYIDFDGTNAWTQADIELTPFATSWYIPVSQSDASYCTELGYQAPDGRFARLGRSNVVMTPRDGVSPHLLPHWFTPPERQPSPPPAPETSPVPLTTMSSVALNEREASSWSSARSPLEHLSSWSFGRGASPTQVRSGTIAE